MRLCAIRKMPNELNIWCVILVLVVFPRIYWCGPQSTVTQYINERTTNGYHFRYATSDHQEREETGLLVFRRGQEIMVVKGYYSYLLDGKIYKVTYEADERGYRAKTSVRIQELAVRTPFRSVNRIGGAALASLAGGGLG